jgi:predicted nucleotidyltransferase
VDSILNPFIAEAQKIILAHIPLNEYSVFVYGSRAGDQFKAYSDLDIGVLGETSLPLDTLFKIKNLLRDSTIPYKVDLVDFKNVSGEFKRIAMKKIQVWNHPQHLTIN